MKRQDDTPRTDLSRDFEGLDQPGNGCCGTFECRVVVCGGSTGEVGQPVPAAYEMQGGENVARCLPASVFNVKVEPLIRGLALNGDRIASQARQRLGEEDLPQPGQSFERRVAPGAGFPAIGPFVVTRREHHGMTKPVEPVEAAPVQPVRAGTPKDVPDLDDQTQVVGL